MAEQAAVQRKKHSVTIEDRNNLRVSGISEVSSYDTTAVVVESDCGRLVIQGAGLHINSFDQSSGNLLIAGQIEALQYLENRQKSESFFARLLK